MSVTNITIITFPCAVLFTYVGTCNINVLYDLLYMTRSIEMCLPVSSGNLYLTFEVK